MSDNSVKPDVRVKRGRGFELPAPLPIDEMRTIFGYEPDSGRLFWNVTRRGVGQAGTTAGSPQPHGYLSIMFKGKRYQVHVMIWYIVTGEWLPGRIDHEDLNGGNNRWINLRKATHQQNGWNVKGRTKSGYKGVYPTPNGKFTARIKVNGKIINYPSRVSAEEAWRDYCAAARQYFGEFARFD